MLPVTVMGAATPQVQSQEPMALCEPHSWLFLRPPVEEPYPYPCSSWQHAKSDLYRSHNRSGKHKPEHQQTLKCFNVGQFTNGARKYTAVTSSASILIAAVSDLAVLLHGRAIQNTSSSYCSHLRPKVVRLCSGWCSGRTTVFLLNLLKADFLRLNTIRFVAVRVLVCGSYGN